MEYQWYPGHMTRAKREMQEDMKLIDLLIELVDARIPMGSRNPDIDSLGKNKSRIVLLNKADLADPHINQEWRNHFADCGVYVLEINARTGTGVKGIGPLVRQACRDKLERDKKRGIKNRPVRAMVAGIPNVGKSTFINTFAGKACTKTGNRPGVTKGKQWIRLNRELELLDTPGILWPRFEDQKVGFHLALIGSIKDELLPKQELALGLLDYVSVNYPVLLSERYGVQAGGNAVELLEEICESRKCYKKGGEKDLDRAAALLLEDFRSGRIGRISLERP